MLKKFIPLWIKRRINRLRYGVVSHSFCGPGLKVIIKSPVPFDTDPRQWGDYHFALGLAEAFHREGCSVRVDFRDNWYARQPEDNGCFVLCLRGLEAYSPDPRDLNVIWVISHPAKVTRAELARYDASFAAGRLYDCEYLPQCTDPRRFHFDRDVKQTSRPLFVGNSRGVLRTIVRDCLRADVPIDIVGRGWKRSSIPSAVRGWVVTDHVPNHELVDWYNAAPVVLSDQWDDMGYAGFIPNRIFDAYACGAFVVTAPLLTDLSCFKGRVLAYKGLDHLRQLCTTPPLKRQDIGPISDSFDARAAVLLARFRSLLGQKSIATMSAWMPTR